MTPGHQDLIRGGVRLLIASVLIYGLTTVLLPFAFPIICGGIISTLSRPYYSHVLKLVRSKPLAALLTVLTIILVVLLPLTGIFALLFREISSASHSISSSQVTLDSINTSLTTIGSSFGIDGPIEIQEYIKKALVFISDKSVVVIGSVLGALANLFIALITTFYLLQNQDTFHKAVAAFSPMRTKDTEHILNRTRQVVQATVSGNLVLVGLQVLVGTTGFLIFGISSPLLLGSLYGVASLIPGIGSVVVWGPVAIFQIIQGNVLAAIGIMCWSIAQILLLDNYIGPKLIENKAHLHPFLILLGVLGGVSQFGFVGIVVGPTLIALGIVGLEILSRTWQSHPE